jgi:hypothetical protein
MDKQANLQAIKDTIGKYLTQAGDWAQENPEITGAAVGGLGGALLSGGGLGRRTLAGLGGAGLGYFAGSQYGKAQKNRALADANMADLSDVKAQLYALQAARADSQRLLFDKVLSAEAPEAAAYTRRLLQDLSE